MDGVVMRDQLGFLMGARESARHALLRTGRSFLQNRFRGSPREIHSGGAAQETVCVPGGGSALTYQ